MMAGFLTPQQTTEEIVASVLDGIISDVERKAKNRARKKRQKAKKKRDKEYSWFMSPKDDDKYRFCNSADSKAKAIAKRTEDELKPLGYKFVEFYDTILWDECEKPLHQYIIKSANGATCANIPSGALQEVGEKFISLSDKLPKDIIIYCDPASHNFTVMMMSHQFSPKIAYTSNYLIWVDRAEQFHYSRYTDTPQSFFNSQINLIKSKIDVAEVRMVECPICMEEKKVAYHTDVRSEVSTARCCGKEVCDTCMNQFLVEKSQVKVKTRPNGKKFLEMRNPEYTCPLCRGGFFHPEEPRRISDEWLKTWSNAIHDINGEVVEEENKVDQINKFNRELMDFM